RRRMNQRIRSASSGVGDIGLLNTKAQRHKEETGYRSSRMDTRAPRPEPESLSAMEPRAEMIGATPLARISAEAVSQLGPSSNKKGAPVFPAPLAEILPD